MNIRIFSNFNSVIAEAGQSFFIINADVQGFILRNATNTIWRLLQEKYNRIDPLRINSNDHLNGETKTIFQSPL